MNSLRSALVVTGTMEIPTDATILPSLFEHWAPQFADRPSRPCPLHWRALWTIPAPNSSRAETSACDRSGIDRKRPMTAYQAIETSDETKAEPRIADDMALLRAAVNLTRDIADARPAIFWTDMLVSAVVGYA